MPDNHIPSPAEYPTGKSVHDLFSILDFDPLFSEPPAGNHSFAVGGDSFAYEMNAFLDLIVKTKTAKFIPMVKSIREEIIRFGKPEEATKELGSEVREKSASLIDSFLENNAWLRKKHRNEATVSEMGSVQASIEKDEDMVTETLAKLHIRQNNMDEAIRIYQKLCLLFPEKSAYFDAQINKISKK